MAGGEHLQNDNLDGGSTAIVEHEDGAPRVLFPGDNDASQTDKLDRVVVVEVEVLTCTLG